MTHSIINIIIIIISRFNDVTRVDVTNDVYISKIIKIWLLTTKLNLTLLQSSIIRTG